MGSGDWLKSIISLKKGKDDCSKQKKGSSARTKSNGYKWKNHPWKESTSLANRSTSQDPRVLVIRAEDLAAVRIQTAFRAYKARKNLRRLKGTVRLQLLTQGYSSKKQATTTLSHLHSWSKVQVQIRARRLCMVTEGRLRQKKLENQLKLEAKLHDVEVGWCGGSEAMEETLARIYQREEATVKRERAMAYAFSHQWRANSNHHGLGNYELSKANWGWSWLERWIAARPWECRVPQSISPKKPSSQGSNAGKNANLLTPKSTSSVKTPLSNGKRTMKARRLTYPAAEIPSTNRGNIKAEETSIKKEQSVS